MSSKQAGLASHSIYSFSYYYLRPTDEVVYNLVIDDTIMSRPYYLDGGVSHHEPSFLANAIDSALNRQVVSFSLWPPPFLCYIFQLCTTRQSMCNIHRHQKRTSRPSIDLTMTMIFLRFLPPTPRLCRRSKNNNSTKNSK